MSSTSSLVSTREPKSYIRYGIGGAGNYHKKTNMPSAPSTPAIAPRTCGQFTSGIGGVGNIHYASERAILSFDEEVARGRAVQRNPSIVFHTGIGGAGNRTGERSTSASSTTSTSSAKSSGEFSEAPLPYGLVDRMQRKLSSAVSVSSTGEKDERRKSSQSYLRSVLRI